MSPSQEQHFRASLPAWIDFQVDSGTQMLPDRSAMMEVLLHVLRPVTAQVISSSPRLRLIQKIGVGVNTIDLGAARDHGIRVANMPGTNSQAVCEHTLMLILSVLRKVKALDSEVRSGSGWNIRPQVFKDIGEVSGKVVGFLGFGEIPRRLAPVLTALGARVRFSSSKQLSSHVAQACSFEQLLAQSDILSLHVPLTVQTNEIIDRSALALMRPGAILINTARGGLIDQDALVSALSSGRLGGAGLDVMANEPMAQTDPLADLPNVVLTPHVAWLTRETWLRSFCVIRENCRRLRDLEPLLHEIM